MFLGGMLMSAERYQRITDWKEADLLDLPTEETGEYEYKSSRIWKEKGKELKRKLAVAASAFWNSGGGVFVAGIDDSGKIDGGIPEYVGRQKLRDWVDQVLASVEPAGLSAVATIEKEADGSAIDEGHVVLVVSFAPSSTGPHMGPERKYYARAGAHSGEIGHFLIEAIWARRRLQDPVLRGLIRQHPNKAFVRELVILALNDAPALDVSVSFEPLPRFLEDQPKERLPLTIPVVDRAHPFRMDILVRGGLVELFGEEPVELVLEYKDIAQRVFQERQSLDPRSSVAPIKMGDEDMTKIDKTLGKIHREMRLLRDDLKRYRMPAQEDRSP